MPLKYQWWDGTNKVKNGSVKNGPTISGATTNVLIISNVQTTNTGKLHGSPSLNNFGSVWTVAARLEVITNIPPAITVQPISQTNGVGSTVSFVVFGTGSLPIHFQWQKDGVNLVNGLINGATISGATTNKLTISKVQLTNAGNYTLIITNFGGSVTSSVAVLTVESIPVIFVQPATNQSMAVGSTAAFAVTAIGTVPLKYQWWDGTNKVKNGSVNNGPTISGSDHQCADHQQRPNHQYRKLHGRRDEHRRVGHQFGRGPERLPTSRRRSPCNRPPTCRSRWGRI